MKITPPLHLAAAALIAFGGLAVAPGTALAGPVSTEFLLSGAIEHPGTYDLAALKSLPATVQDVKFTSGSGLQTHTYTGTNLWGLIDGAGLRLNPNVNNDALRYYVTATGSDGYRAVFSLGEINPLFGNQPDLVAYAEESGGTTQPLGADGFARTTAPGDLKGGRYVSNLVSLDVRHSASQLTGTGGGLSTAVTVSGLVGHSVTLDAAGLAGLGVAYTTQTVGTDVYGGYGLWDLLNSPAIGITTDPAIKNDILGLYVVATGSDGYQAVFSMGELAPDFGHQPDLLALDLNGAPLSTSGFARLVIPNDVRRGRWVSNLVALEVFRADEVPLPPTFALLALGLALVRGRRRVVV
jgi:hypothetical protein